jgi:hypothetical protein
VIRISRGFLEPRALVALDQHDRGRRGPAAGGILKVSANLKFNGASRSRMPPGPESLQEMARTRHSHGRADR